jgi:hypothetical protein
MRHYYKVKAHIEAGVFELVNGEEIRHASLDELEYNDPDELVGKEISVSYFKPYIEIGVSPKIEN